MKSILDPTFRYTSSLQTDIRKTFERVRRELRDTSCVGRGARNGNVLALQRGPTGFADQRRVR